MDFQTRKLNLISYLAQVQDETILYKIENLIVSRKNEGDEVNLEPFTMEEFIDRIQKSEKDFKNGKYKTQAELEKIMENW